MTNALVSGTISTRNGGFAVAPYLYRDYYSISFLRVSTSTPVAPYLYRDYYS